MSDDTIYNEVAKTIVNTLPLLRLKFYKFTPGFRKSHLHKHHMPPAQFITLMILSEHGSMPMSKLAKHINTSKPNMTMLVDRMETAGYVERKGSETDRRVVEIALTEKARTAMQEHRDHMLSKCRQSLEQLQEEDVKRLNELLKEMAEIFSRAK